MLLDIQNVPLPGTTASFNVARGIVGNARVRALKKGVPCIWHWHSTDIKWHDHNIGYFITYPGVLNPPWNTQWLYIDWQVPNETKHTYSFKRSTYHSFPKWIVKDFDEIDVQYAGIHSKIHTQGTGWWTF